MDVAIEALGARSDSGLVRLSMVHSWVTRGLRRSRDHDDSDEMAESGRERYTFIMFM
jgi:hypothetical protein